jgi:hypothetical protein
MARIAAGRLEKAGVLAENLGDLIVSLILVNRVRCTQ